MKMHGTHALTPHSGTVPLTPLVFKTPGSLYLDTMQMHSYHSLVCKGVCGCLTAAKVHRRDDLTERMDGRVCAGMVTLRRGLVAFQQGRKLCARLHHTQHSFSVNMVLLLSSNLPLVDESSHSGAAGSLHART